MYNTHNQSRLPALEEELARARGQMERLLKEGEDAADAWRGQVAALEAKEEERQEAATSIAALEREVEGLREEHGALRAAAQEAAQARGAWAEEKEALVERFEGERTSLERDADVLRQQLEGLQALAAEGEERAQATVEELGAKLKAAEAQAARDRGEWDGERASLQRAVEAATTATVDLQRLHEQEVASLGRGKAAAEEEAARWRAACGEEQAAAAAAVASAKEEERQAVMAQVETEAAALAASLGLLPAWTEAEGRDWTTRLDSALRQRLEGAAAEVCEAAEEKAAMLSAVVQYGKRLRALVAGALGGDAAGEAAAAATAGLSAGEEQDAKAVLQDAAASVDWLLGRARSQTESTWAARLVEQEEQGRRALEAAVVDARAEGDEMLARERRAAVEKEAASWRRRLDEAVAAREVAEAEAVHARASLEEQEAAFDAHLERLEREHERKVQAAVAARNGEWVARWEAGLRAKVEEAMAARERGKAEVEAAWQARFASVLGEKERFYQRKVEEAQRAAKQAVDEMRVQADLDARRSKEDWAEETRAAVLAEARAAAWREVGEREEEMRGVVAEVQMQVASAGRAVELAQAEADARVRAAVEAARREAWERERVWEREAGRLRRGLREAEAALAVVQQEEEERKKVRRAPQPSALSSTVGVHTEESQESIPPPPAGAAVAAAAAAAVVPAATALVSPAAAAVNPKPPSPFRPAAVSSNPAPSATNHGSSALRSALLAGDAGKVRALLSSSQPEASLLPVHTAVQGLVFHGSLPALLATLDALLASPAASDLLAATDERGDTCLHRALKLPSLQAAAAVAEKLLALDGEEEGAGTSSAACGLLAQANAEGKTPLQLVVGRAVASAEGVALLSRLVLVLGSSEGQKGGGGSSLLNAALLAAVATCSGSATPPAAPAAGAKRPAAVTAAAGAVAAAVPRALEVLSLLQAAGLAGWDAKWRDAATGKSQGDLLASL